LFCNPNVFRSLLSFLIIFVCLFSAIMCSCNLSFTPCWVCPLCHYVYLYCAVSVLTLLLLTRHINNKEWNLIERIELNYVSQIIHMI
jgi:hypothetical protein